MIGLQKQTLSHSSMIFHLYAVELNCKLFFVCATYFLNCYIRRGENEKKILTHTRPNPKKYQTRAWV
jgi:hypothetical protein